jgi:hypothetical protein
MSKPILAMIPSAYRSGTVYSVLPNNGDGDFTFSRTGSATRVNKDGFIETVASDVPRLDYSDGSCPALLLEPQRTNVITYSEDFSNAYWTKRGLCNVDENIVSPYGNNDAFILEYGRRSTNDFYKVGIPSSDGVKYSLSFYLKNINNLTQFVYIANGQSGDAYGSWKINMSLVSNDKWERITENHESVEVLNEFISNGPSIGIQFYSGTSSLTELISFGLFGIQLEQGNYPTSYIPTSGSQETRNADVCYGAGNSDLFNDTEGSLFIDVTPYESPTLHRISLSDGSLDNKVSFFFEINNTQVRFIITSNGVVQIDNYQTLGRNSRSKLLMTFKENECKIYINGTLAHTDTSFVVPTNLDRLNFARDNGSADFFNGKVHDTRVYDRVLTEAEAIELTTL